MIYILLSILCSTGISVIFKITQQLGIKLFHIILINYIIAFLTGIILAWDQFSVIVQPEYAYLPFAAMIGVLFILMFYLIGLSTHKAGISVTTIATRMAVVIPVLFSIIYYQEQITLYKTFAFSLAFLAVILAIVPAKFTFRNNQTFFLPLLIFLGAGLVDSLVKFVQQSFLTEGGLSIFSTVLFAFAGICGIVVFIIRKGKFRELLNMRTLMLGSLMGFVNFGSIYFFVNALNTNVFESSVIFGINHIGIVSFSVLLALLIFKEKLSKLNWTGVLLTLVSLFLLSKI